MLNDLTEIIIRCCQNFLDFDSALNIAQFSYSNKEVIQATIRITLSTHLRCIGIY